METALSIRPRTARGTERLLHHCLALARAEEPRAPAVLRLEQELGPELARLLLAALAPPQRRRGCSSP